MLKYFGRPRCLRCDVDLIHEFDLAGDWVPPESLTTGDQRWLCPNCGYSRPVIYSVERRPRVAMR